MDIARTRPKSRRTPLLLAGGAALLVLTLLGASRLRPAAPEVEGSTLWIDTVRRGPMLRAVNGSGTLVPESQRIVSAPRREWYRRRVGAHDAGHAGGPHGGAAVRIAPRSLPGLTNRSRR